MRRLLCFLLCMFLVGCSAAQQPAESSATASKPAITTGMQTTSTEPRATTCTTTAAVTTTTRPVIPEEERILQRMSPEEKVGQLFLLPVSSTVPDDASRALFEVIQPGGFIFFADAIESVEQTRTLVTALCDTVSIPPFLATDQEGGRVQRIKPTDSLTVSRIPAMKKIGANPILARDIGTVIGTELRVFGINMDFAPCADVYSNPQNTVIGDRAFSADPKISAECSVALSDGLSQTGVIPVCKHFPGHGDTRDDTHTGFAASDKTLDALYETELIPFLAQIENDAPAIMAAHISLPHILGDMTPCTMSQEIITGLLRTELGYDGVVITDAMNMGAIANHYTSAEAAVEMIHAGCDILLMPEDPMEAYQAVLDAVTNGTISMERINESVLRILKLKLRYALSDTPVFYGKALLNSPLHQEILAKVN